MEITTRERIILDYLMDSQQKLTVKELAKKMEVSSRTIHRDLNNVEELLETFHLKLVRKAGVGIQVIGTDDNMSSLRTYMGTHSSKELTLEERQVMILATLYESLEPVKLFALAHDLGVATATISADLVKLEEQLAPFQLSVLKKRGYGIELEGTERAKRRAISYVIAQSLKEDEWVSFVKQRVQNTTRKRSDLISERLLHLVDQDKLADIEGVMHGIYHDFPFPITDNAYAGLIVHLALAINRIELGEGIEMEADYLNELSEEPEYQAAQLIIDRLSEHFHIEIPEAEVGYITMHLQGAKLRHYEGEILEASNLEAFIQAKKLIQAIEEATGEELMSNEPLLEGLVTHLKPAIYRIRQKMGIANPLVDRIRKDYKELFQLIKQSVDETFPGLLIPDEEIAYLVMHFGSVLLNAAGKKDLKAYVVCASGIGTSKMLASKLQHEIAEIAEIETISMRELNETDVSDRDLVISTMPLHGYSNEYLVVNPIISEQEMEQVKLYARRQLLVKRKSHAADIPVTSTDEIIERLNRLRLLTEAAAVVLSNFKHVFEPDVMSVKGYLSKMCAALEEQDIIRDSEAVVQALFAREALGGIGIPGTRLAFYHTRHEEIKHPSFTVHTLKEPIWIQGTDGQRIECSQLLLLLAPLPYHQQGLEVLSHISTLLVESEESLAVFETEEHGRILSFLAEKLDQFIYDKQTKRSF